MTDGGEDDGLPIGQQKAFSDAYVLIQELVNQGVSLEDVSCGVFVAALCALRKCMTDTEVAAYLYHAADDYAVRHMEE